MAFTYELNSVENIRKGIKSVTGRAESLQGDIQSLCVATLNHTAEHGDWTLSRELIEGITKSKGVKSRQLTLWFEAFMAATYGKDESGDENVFVYDEGKAHGDINVEQAKAVNWYDMKPPKSDRVSNLESVRDAAIKEAKRGLKAKTISQAEFDGIGKMFDALINGEDAEIELPLMDDDATTEQVVTH